MGIKGLTSFIDANPHVLHPFQLRNCCVVIDGNNFYHYLYYACHVNCALGGDYDTYRKKIISTFKGLEKCGVTPYVILDGAYPVDDRKLWTSLTRATMRNTLVSVMARFGRGQVLPILAYDTFIQTLTELGVRHATCQFEADREIAVLANKLKCPVISNDSDFYIFDLVGGFLPLDYVDFRPLCPSESPESANAVWYLHSQIYRVDNFISAFKGLSRPALPVFACLLGNDFISPKAFDSFYRRLQAPKVISKQYKLSPRLTKIISVLHWFHVHNKDWSNLLQEVVHFLRPERQSKLRKLFYNSLNIYSNIEDFEGCNLYAYFHGECEAFDPIAGPGFAGFSGMSFPSWFLTSVCRGEICPSTMNAAVLHRIIFLTQVEDLSFVSAYQCSQKIRKILYGILFRSDPVCKEQISSGEDALSDGHNHLEHFMDKMKPKASETPEHHEGVKTISEDLEVDGTDGTTENVSDEEKDNEEEEVEEEVAVLMSRPTKSVMKQTQVEEYVRVKRRMACSFLNPILHYNDSQLPTLADLEDLPESSLNFLLYALDVDETFVGNFSEDIRLYSSCLSTWLRNSDPKMSERHLDCVLLCVIYLSIYDKLSCELYKNKELKTSVDRDAKRPQTDSNGHNEAPRISLSITWNSIPRDQLQKVLQNLTKFHKSAPSFNHKNHMQPSIIHAFAQLQACMLDASNLNKLLRFPLPNIRPACLHNGTFLYNLFEDLTSRPRPELYLATLLLPDSAIHKVFLDFKAVVLEFLPENVLQEASKKFSGKSKKQRKKVKSAAKPRPEHAVKSSESDEDKEITVVSGFDISNKFSSLLSLDG